MMLVAFHADTTLAEETDTEQPIAKDVDEKYDLQQPPEISSNPLRGVSFVEYRDDMVNLAMHVCSKGEVP
jgi:hypothetical protein